MSWTLSFWVAAALLALCRGQNTFYEGNTLSESGYHLCIHNETRTVSFLVVHEVPYTVTKPCGGWLLWKTCTVTLYRMTYQTEYRTVVGQVTRCCSGYVQVGRYCALPVNRSRNFSAKPGSCPTGDGLLPKSEDCEWDMDCPGWQKCCQRMGHSFCSDPAGSTNSSENGRYRLNTTVTVKTDYQQLMSADEGLLNHTRLLQALVTGVLQSDDVSVCYFSSWAVHPYKTATSLLVDFSFTPLYNVTSGMHLLLKHIPEVSAVTVEDIDECAEPALHQCSPLAYCNNTMGSYKCTCRKGYTDVDPSNPGAHCTADVRVWITTESPLTYLPRINTTYTSDSNATHNPPGESSLSILNSSEASMTKPLSNTSSVPFNSSRAPQWTPFELHTSRSSTVELPLPTTTCSPPSITSLQSANVTGTSFCMHWSSQIQTNQTYWVVLSKGSEVIHFWETSQTKMRVRGLEPGMLYKITVTPHSCGSHGRALYILVRTDAQTVDATARLTNIQFSADLQNTSSQAYKTISESITDEIYQSLCPEMKAMVDSGQVRIEIRSFSPGSVVVNFTFIVTPIQSQDISAVLSALLLSLINSSKYTVDKNSTSINDFNECASGENDCSQWAACTNTWGSYTCACLDGYIDNNPERPGRACQEIATLETTPPQTPTILPIFSTIPFSEIKPLTTYSTLTSVTTTPGQNRAPILPTEMVSTRVTSTTLVSNTPIVTGVQVVIPVQAATTSSTSTSTSAITTTTIDPTTPNTTDLSSTNIAYATTIMAASPSPTSTTQATTTTADPLTTNTTDTTALTTASLTNCTHAITTTIEHATTTNDSTTSVALRNASNASILRAVSVQCRVAAITVTVVRDFLLNNKIRESTLYLGLQGCGVNGGNTTHAELTVAWNECGTRLVHNDTYYTASVTLFNNLDSYISPSATVEVPRTRLEVPIMCTYKKSMLMSSDFGSMGYDMIKDIIMGSGSFDVTVELLNGSAPLPHNYSVSRQEVVVVEVSVNTSSEQIKVIVNKCWATPTSNPADNYNYTFLENSCSLNTYTKVLMNGNSSKSRVSVQIFSLVNLDVIYLHCQVQICVQIGSETCEINCLQRTARSSNTIGTTYRSVGPLQRTVEKSSEQEYDTVHVIGLSCLGVGLSLFFIVGFVCLFYYQRNRIGHYNFTVKTKQENFTFLVFNA